MVKAVITMIRTLKPQQSFQNSDLIVFPNLDHSTSVARFCSKRQHRGMDKSKGVGPRLPRSIAY